MRTERPNRPEYTANLGLMQTAPAPAWPNIEAARAAVARVRRERRRNRVATLGALVGLFLSAFGFGGAL